MLQTRASFLGDAPMVMHRHHQYSQISKASVQAKGCNMPSLAWCVLLTACVFALESWGWERLGSKGSEMRTCRALRQCMASAPAQECVQW